MKNTTLCYIEDDDRYLMLHRTKKENDENHDKWIGVGGKIEEGESPEECLLREVLEETGLSLTGYEYRGLITFVSNEWGTEYMHLFTADSFTGEILPCDEGNLEWIDKDRVTSLRIWEGDKEIFKALEESRGFFTMKLVYDGEKLVDMKMRRYHMEVDV